MTSKTSTGIPTHHLGYLTFWQEHWVVFYNNLNIRYCVCCLSSWEIYIKYYLRLVIFKTVMSYKCEDNILFYSEQIPFLLLVLSNRTSPFLWLTLFYSFKISPYFTTLMFIVTLSLSNGTWFQSNVFAMLYPYLYRYIYIYMYAYSSPSFSVSVCGSGT